MTTEDFLDVLEDRQLVSKNVIEQLRRKAAQGDHRITAKSILKFLVKKELVTRTQARQLLETTLTVSPNAESSILGLVPMPKAAAKPGADAASAAPKAEAEPETKPAAEPKEPAPARPTEPAASVRAPGSDKFGVADIGRPADFLAGSGLADAEPEYDPLAGEDVSAASPGKGAKKKQKRKKRDHRKENEWDSPLLMLGFGALAVLVVGGALIYYLLIRENADKTLQEAGEMFNSGSYSQAITLYEQFVKNWPRHSEISDARVRLGMARLWRDTKGKSDFTRALETALEVTDAIEDEPAFNTGGDDEAGLSQAKREMSELLTQIAVGLANQAEATDDGAAARELIEKAKVAIALCNNTKLVPQRFRLATELDAARETLDRVEKRLARNEDLAKALAAMDAAMAAGDSAAAFSAHKALLDQYPLLVDNEQLAEKIREVAAAEQAQVKFTATEKAAETTDIASPVIATVTLADRQGAAAADAQGIAAVRIDGNLYGLSLRDGSLLWRRRVGAGAAQAPPRTNDGRLVAIDADRNQVIALDADSGELAWRQPLEETLHGLALHEQRLLVAGESGKLFALDAATGALQGHVQFGQAIRVRPTFSPRGDRIYVVGDHSNLYTLSGEDLACIGVHYLGHAQGSVTAPAHLVLNKAVVAENTGLETCRLHVLQLDKRGVASREVTTKRLQGLVLSPLLGAGRRFAALTTLGGVSVFEVGSGDDPASLTELAERDAPNRRQAIPFGAMIEGSQETALWIADRRLQKLGVLPTGNRLPARALKRDYAGDAFDHELIVADRLLVHARRPRGGAGAIVAAVDVQTNEPAWEVELAVPPAGAPAVDPSGLRITAVGASGAAYLLDRQALASRVQNEAVRAASTLDQPLTSAIDLGNGRMAAAAIGSPQIVHVRPAAPRGPVTLVATPSPLTAPPAAWADGFLAPTSVGQVFYYSAEDGAALAAPFQPPLTPGQEVDWLAPAPIAGDVPQFAVSDRAAKVYLVRLARADGDAQLELAAEADVGQSPLETPLVAAGGYVVAGNAEGALAQYKLPELEPAEPAPLGGRAAWGPHAAGEGVLVALDSGELVLVHPGAGVAWRQPLKQELAAAPLVDESSAWLLQSDGVLIRIHLADGAETDRIELGQPAVAGPTAFGQRLIVAAPDGSLLVVEP